MGSMIGVSDQRGRIYRAKAVSIKDGLVKVIVNASRVIVFTCILDRWVIVFHCILNLDVLLIIHRTLEQVHYPRWRSTWDEWIELDSPRLSMVRTRLSAPAQPSPKELKHLDPDADIQCFTQSNFLNNSSKVDCHDDDLDKEYSSDKQDAFTATCGSCAKDQVVTFDAQRLTAWMQSTDLKDSHLQMGGDWKLELQEQDELQDTNSTSYDQRDTVRDLSQDTAQEHYAASDSKGKQCAGACINEQESTSYKLYLDSTECEGNKLMNEGMDHEDCHGACLTKDSNCSETMSEQKPKTALLKFKFFKGKHKLKLLLSQNHEEQILSTAQSQEQPSTLISERLPRMRRPSARFTESQIAHHKMRTRNETNRVISDGNKTQWICSSDVIEADILLGNHKRQNYFIGRQVRLRDQHSNNTVGVLEKFDTNNLKELKALFHIQVEDSPSKNGRAQWLCLPNPDLDIEFKQGETVPFCRSGDVEMNLSLVLSSFAKELTQHQFL